MPPPVVSDPRSTAPRERPLVLFIEDNLTQLDLYAMVLEEALDVVKATRGETGYDVACCEHPDVIVLDILLPDVDGLALCARLHANPATAAIPIIVLTGDARAYARAQLVRSELTGVLLKPCPADRLLAAVRMAIDRSEG
jgi:CheY-like chemotaxis protein